VVFLHFHDLHQLRIRARSPYAGPIDIRDRSPCVPLLWKERWRGFVSMDGIFNVIWPCLTDRRCLSIRRFFIVVSFHLLLLLEHLLVAPDGVVRLVRGALPVLHLLAVLLLEEVVLLGRVGLLSGAGPVDRVDGFGVCVV
jgi:hypothetical protein